MKKIITLSILFTLSIRSFGQLMPMDSVSHRFIQEGVVKVDSMSIENIFNAAKEWLVRNLKSSDSNINLNDKDSQSLTATGNIHLENRANLACTFRDMNLNFKFSVFIKEGKYKYIVENFYCTYVKLCGEYGGTIPGSEPFEEISFGNSKKEKIYIEANTKILSLISDLEKFVKSSGNNKKSEW